MKKLFLSFLSLALFIVFFSFSSKTMSLTKAYASCNGGVCQYEVNSICDACGVIMPDAYYRIILPPPNQ